MIKIHSQDHYRSYAKQGSAIASEREPKSGLSQVYNSKLGHIGSCMVSFMVYIQSLLEIKTIWLVDKITSWLNGYLMKWLVDEMP